MSILNALPYEYLRTMFAALKSQDCDAFGEHMNKLATWLNAGGHAPVVYWEGKPCDVLLTYGDTSLCLRTRIGTLRCVPMEQLSLYPTFESPADVAFEIDVPTA